MLLVEQLLEKALAVADRVYALVQGNIVLEAPTSESQSAAAARARLFRTREPHGGILNASTQGGLDPVNSG